MPTTNLDQKRTEPQSKLYVRYSKSEAFNKENKTPDLVVNVERYLDVDTTSLRNFRNDPAQEAETIQDLDRGIWERMYLQLKNFVNGNGHTNIPTHPNYDCLKDWINRQILNKPFLSESQFLKLDKLGLNWNIALSREHAWELMLARLRDFKKKNGSLSRTI